MHILVLSNYYPLHSIGSYELQCCQICHQLSKHAHRVTVLTSKPSAEAVNHPRETRVFRELELYGDNPAAEPGFRQLFRTVRFNRAVLERHLAATVPDAIMIWGMDRLPSSLLQLAEESGIPCLYAIYDHWLARACAKDPWSCYWEDDDPAAPLSRTLLRGFRLEKLVHKRAPTGTLDSLRFENIYFCSDSLKRETSRACGRSFEHARVIPWAISPADIRSKEGLATQNHRILLASQLTEEKDPITALRAIQELRHRGDERFTLDIFGRGRPEFESSLHDYVRRFQLGGTVSFKPIAEEQVHNSIHLYDALICTSKSPEPFPLMPLKAMAAKVPVISTLEGASGELIRDGENGLVFETSNHHQLADRIVQLADHPDQAQRMVTTAFADVNQQYDIARVTSRIESLLHGAARTEGPREQAV